MKVTHLFFRILPLITFLIFAERSFSDTDEVPRIKTEMGVIFQDMQALGSEIERATSAGNSVAAQAARSARETFDAEISTTRSHVK